jgi:2-haloacid dehalogenase
MTTFTRRMLLDTVLSAAVAGVLERPASAGSQVGATARQRIIVFDVNETLLDVGALAPQFQHVFGNAGVAQEWFSNVVLYSQVATIAGPYVEFGTIARAALDMTAVAHGVMLAPTDRDGILRGLVSLPAHPDVPDGLQKLRASGFRLVTLTNSAPTAVEQQLKNAGIGEYFERSFSVDAVRKFKPAAEVYRLVATELQVAPPQLRLVAAHAWDILGAMRAGCAAAFVERPGKALFPLADKPDIVGPDLRNVADQIVKRDMPK